MLNWKEEMNPITKLFSQSLITKNSARRDTFIKIIKFYVTEYVGVLFSFFATWFGTSWSKMPAIGTSFNTHRT